MFSSTTSEPSSASEMAICASGRAKLFACAGDAATSATTTAPRM
jgi:hypothetical protein